MAVTAKPLFQPEPAGSADDSPLTDAQVESWRSAGYALVAGLLPDDLIASVASDGAARFPAADSPAAEDVRGFGSAVVFPAASDAVNKVTLHLRLLAAVAQLLDRPATDLRLTQSDLWPKYGRSDGAPIGRYDNQDQRIQVDYPNHTLVHPARWNRPEAVEMIVYYSDVDDCGGPTAVVPRHGDDDRLYGWSIVAEAYLADVRPDLTDFRRQLYGCSYWCPETIAAVEARYGPLGFDATPYRLACR